MPDLYSLVLICRFANGLSDFEWSFPKECLSPVKCYLQSNISSEISVL